MPSPHCPECNKPLVEFRATVTAQNERVAKGRADLVSMAGGGASQSDTPPSKDEQRGLRGQLPKPEAHAGGGTPPPNPGFAALKVSNVPAYRCNYCGCIYFTDAISTQVDAFAQLVPEKGVTTLPYEAAVARL